MFIFCRCKAVGLYTFGKEYANKFVLYKNQDISHRVITYTNPLRILIGVYDIKTLKKRCKKMNGRGSNMPPASVT